MTPELKRKAGLVKQTLQTIKYCQKALLHKAHLVITRSYWALQSDTKGVGSIRHMIHGQKTCS